MPYFVIILLFFAGLSYSETNVKPRFSPEMIKSHFKSLANDSMKGRGIGTDGEKAASEYIAEQFKNAGLEPISEDAGYFQNIPVIRTVAASGTDFTAYNDDTSASLHLNEEYLLAQYTRNSYLPKNAEIIFAGYGIIAPEFDYNDYHETDVSGKIVVMIDGEPLSEDPAYFNGNAPTIYSYPDSKFRTAISRGAIASILLPKPDEEGIINWQSLVRNYSFDEIMLAYTASFNLSLIMKPEAAGILFEGSGYDVEDIYNMYRENQMRSFPLTSWMKFKIKAKSYEQTGRNVIGIIPGTHPVKKETEVLITAHYDHLGTGYKLEGDSIYNGALDNALGVAGLIDLAKVAAQSDIKPERTWIFIALTGEEKGLLGSKYYTDNPVIPLYKTAANINIDGLAFIDEFNEILGIGSEYSEMEMLMDSAAKKTNLNFEKIPKEYKSSEAFNRSDQIAFSQAGIPSVLVLDGISYKTVDNAYAVTILRDYFQNLYHTPFDDTNIPVNYDASVQHLNYIYKFAKLIDNKAEMPEWYKDSPFLNARLRSKAEKR